MKKERTPVIIILILISFTLTACEINYETQKHTLDNGLTLVMKPNPDTGIVAIDTLIKRSLGVEEKKGINNYINKMLLKGTKKRTAEQIINEIESAGGEINIKNYAEFSEIAITIPSEKQSVALEILGDILKNSAYPQEEVDKTKEEIIGELRSKTDLPYVEVEELWMKSAYKGHPFQDPTDGYEKDVVKITREDLIRHDEKWITPNNIIISVAGNINPEKTKKAVKHLFGNMKKGSSEKLSNAKTQGVKIVKDHPSESFFINYGFLTVPATHEDFMPLRVLAGLLGTGSGSRLFYNLREKQGLAYSIYATNPSIGTTGFFRISATVRPDVLNQTLKGIDEQIKRVQTETISKEELRSVKNKLKGFYILDHQKSEDQANHLALYEAVGLGYEHDTNYLNKVENVTAQDIQKVANKYLQDPVIAIVGPFAGIQ